VHQVRIKMCTKLGLKCAMVFFNSTELELHHGPAGGPASDAEAARPSSVPSAAALPPLALEAALPPAALTWGGPSVLGVTDPGSEAGQSELSESGQSELSESGQSELSVLSEVELPRRVTLSWRQLLPRLLYEAAFSYLFIESIWLYFFFFKKGKLYLLYLLEWKYFKSQTRTRMRRKKDRIPMYLSQPRPIKKNFIV